MSNSKNITFTLLKGILFIVLVYVLYLQLNLKNTSYQDLLLTISSLNSKNLVFFLIAVLLMPFNWMLESIKWKTLVNVVQTDFQFLESFKAVLMGVFFGFITPNRVGEFGGRLFNITKGNRVKALNLSFIGGVAQFVVTFLVGSSIGFLFLTGFYKNIYFVMLPFVIVICLTIYFNIVKFVRFVFSFKYLRNFSENYIFQFDVERRLMIKVLGITFLRYSIYVFQYVFILWFFDVALDLFILLQAITSMLLLQTLIPSFALIDLGIRGNILVFLLLDYTDNELIVLFSVFLVWILNLVIPAVIGYIIFLKQKTRNYEKLTDNITTGD